MMAASPRTPTTKRGASPKPAHMPAEAAPLVAILDVSAVATALEASALAAVVPTELTTSQ